MRKYKFYRILSSIRCDGFRSRAFTENINSHQSTSSSSSSSSTSSHLGTLTAAALATAVSLYATASLPFPISISHCESPNWNNNKKSFTSDDVSNAINNVWSRADEQIDRFDAAQPQGNALPRIPPPQIIMHNDTECTVVFQVPRSLDYRNAIIEARRCLRSPPPPPQNASQSPLTSSYFDASTSETSTSGPKGRARRLRRSSSTMGDVIIDILEPHDGDEPVQFEFRGAVNGDNLALLESIVQAAARPGRSTSEWRRYIGEYGNNSNNKNGGGDEYGDDDPFASLFPGGKESFGDLFAPWRELLEEFQRMHTEHHQHRGWGDVLPDTAEQDTADYYPSSPYDSRHYRRSPKRFDDSPSQRSATVIQQSPFDSPQAQRALRKLENIGCQVFLPQSSSMNTMNTNDSKSSTMNTNDTTTNNKQQDTNDDNASNNNNNTESSQTSIKVVDWGGLAGYESQKRAIEDCLLLPLVRPDVYDTVAKGTRERYSSNRPRAILFTGPPGTGKTSSARVIASQAGVPMVYIPLESIMSKWYGESEKTLADALAAADSLPDGGCIFFLDELDALATSRGSGDMHEATRRLLGVLLRHMDGFDASKKSVVVGATNRPQDLDPALLSRFSSTIEFGLPNETCRASILKQYAHQLNDVELKALANATAGMSGRDLRDVCEQAERRWAAKIIRNQVMEDQLPPIKEYMEAANARLREMGSNSLFR